MDIFNRKRVKELERDLENAKWDKNRILSDLRCLEAKFGALGDFPEAVPEDCVRGPWCKACEFVKTYHYSSYYTRHSEMLVAYVCGKGESCKQFVQRESPDCTID